MARRNSTNTEAPASPTEESTVSTETETPPELVTPTDEAAPAVEVVIDLTAFEAALEKAVEQRDETTGALPEVAFPETVTEYRKLEGAKPKNAAKKLVDEAMKSSMQGGNLPLARAYLEVSTKLVAGPVSSTSTREPKLPADPTEAFVERVSGLVLAAQLVQDTTPEGVKEDWAEKVQESVTSGAEQAKAYHEWLVNEAEDKGDAPETPAFVQAAVKLALGKSAKVGGTRKASTSGSSPFTGDRRDVAKHIESAFAGVESGTFLKIAEIRKHTSDEYGTDHPSAGAVSARLFPKSGKVTVEGVIPTTDDKGNKGAKKA